MLRSRHSNDVKNLFHLSALLFGVRVILRHPLLDVTMVPPTAPGSSPTPLAVLMERARLSLQSPGMMLPGSDWPSMGHVPAPEPIAGANHGDSVEMVTEARGAHRATEQIRRDFASKSLFLLFPQLRLPPPLPSTQTLVLVESYSFLSAWLQHLSSFWCFPSNPCQSLPDVSYSPSQILLSSLSSVLRQCPVPAFLGPNRLFTGGTSCSPWHFP